MFSKGAPTKSVNCQKGRTSTKPYPPQPFYFKIYLAKYKKWLTNSAIYQLQRHVDQKVTMHPQSQFPATISVFSDLGRTTA